MLAGIERAEQTPKLLLGRTAVAFYGGGRDAPPAGGAIGAKTVTNFK
jgi:hypothetical protein